MPMLATFGAGSARSFGFGAGGVVIELTFVPTGGGTTIIWDRTTNLSLNASKEYTVTTGRDVSVAIKMWGGGGALGWMYSAGPSNTSNQGPGGGGGYAYGVINFQAGTNYIFQIGEGGGRATSAGSRADWRAGGSQGVHSGYGATEGAGYSGIFVTNASQANSLLIAGGGGAGGDTGHQASGAAGGGAIGQTGTSAEQGGQGGTQSAGGAPSEYNGATAGSALLGGWAAYDASSLHSSLGGGGGGYFGGGGGNVGGGGAGSGYFKPSSPVYSGVTTTGSTSTPANSGDALRSGAGQGAYAGYGSTRGADGAIVLLTV